MHVRERFYLAWVLVVLTSATAFAQTTPAPIDELAADRESHAAASDVSAEEVAERDRRAPTSFWGRLGQGGSERGYQTDFGLGLQGPLFGPHGTENLRAPTANERAELNVAVGVPIVRARLLVESRDWDYVPAFEVGNADAQGRIRVVFNPLVLRGLLSGAEDAATQHYGAYEPRTGITGELTVPVLGAAEIRARLGAAVALALGGAADADGSTGVVALLGRLEGGVEVEFGAEDWRIYSDFIFQESMPYLTNLASLRAFQFNLGVRGPLMDDLSFSAGFNVREERADVRSGLVDDLGVEIVRDAGNANFIGGSVGIVY